MSESCSVTIVNNSGRLLDAVALWHTSGEPSPADIQPSSAVISKANVASGAKLSGSAGLGWSATDYWTGIVKFHGDGTTYLICGLSGAAWKEYEVSDGTSITFTLNGYTTGTTNQADIDIAYSGNGSGTAYLLNSTVAAFTGVANEIAEAAVHVIADLAMA